MGHTVSLIQRATLRVFFSLRVSCECRLVIQLTRIGGTGITHPLSYFLHLLSPQNLGSSRSITRYIHLVWAIRHRIDYDWIRYLVEPALERALTLRPDLDVAIDLFVTNSEYTAAEDTDIPSTYDAIISPPPIRLTDENNRGAISSGNSSSGINTEDEDVDNEKISVVSSAEANKQQITSPSQVRFIIGRPVLLNILVTDLASTSGKLGVIGEFLCSA
jgi:hypothetical protein